jgi:hypothetical protein
VDLSTPVGVNQQTQPSEAQSEAPRCQLPNFLGEENPVKRLVTESYLFYNATDARLAANSKSLTLDEKLFIQSLVSLNDKEVTLGRGRSHRQ